MREIKFRAWDEVNKKMYNDGVFIGLDGDLSFGLPIVKTTYSPFAFEIMQYTGLKDKNGVEIYEGDIVKVSNGKILCGVFSIVWRGCGFWFNNDDDQQLYVFDQAGYILEVIGNIYENPELLDHKL